MTPTRHASRGAATRLAPTLLFAALSLPALAASSDVVVNDRPLAIAAKRATEIARTHPDCLASQPFYWEIGNKIKPLATGSSGKHAPQADSSLRIASATKWWFGAYVVQLRKGNLSKTDISALTMRSGYTSQRFRRCISRSDKRQQALTVQDCFQANGWFGKSNHHHEPSHQGIYFYNGGHFQHWAVSNGLGPLNSSALASAFRHTLSNSLSIAFDTPQPAGGGISSAATFGRFLRLILQGKLLIKNYLGTHAVCTHPQHCPEQTAYTPVPDDLSWSYSLGHWVEDDPASGDGAFSSPGFFGFYPWIDASKRWYGIIAREKRGLFERPAQQSAKCGAAMRQAWLSAFNQFDQ